MPRSDVILSDGTADLQHDSFFRFDVDFLMQLDRMRDTILVRTDRPARNAPTAGATFAIYGAWGTGKSSALAMLRERLLSGHRERLGRNAATSPLYVVDLVAPGYEPFPAVAREIIALKILTAIGADANQQRTAETFALAAANPIELEVWADRIAQVLANGASGGVAAILIDELDRCSPHFTVALLNAVLYWSHLPNLPNLFFVYAVDERHLTASLAAADPLDRDPAVALQKYVQFAVEIPPVLETAANRYRFLEDMLAEARFPRGRRQSVQQYLRRSSGQVLGLLDPLFVTPGSETPRGVKRRVNHFLGRLRAAQAVTDADVKAYVIATLWPSFYHDVVMPNLRGDPGPHVEFLDRLERLGDDVLQTAQGLDLAGAQLLAKHRADQHGLPLGELDPLLVLYAGLSPALASEAADDRGKEPSGPGFRKKGGPGPARPPQSKGVRRSGVTRDELEDELGSLFIRAAAARDRSATSQAAAHVRGALALVLANEATLDDDFTPIIGNIALVAESLNDTEAAQALFEAAMRANPNHANNLQNYVSFILDERLQEKYGLADQLLDRLREPPLDAHRPDRTAQLRQQNAMVHTGQSGESLPPGWAHQLATDFLSRAQNTYGVYATLLRMFGDGGDRSEVETVARYMLERALDPAERYRVLRGAADVLAESPKREDEDKAADLYRYLLSSGLGCVPAVERSEHAAVLHNLATLLEQHDYDHVAGRLWQEAYEADPGDPGIRRAYARSLLGHGHPATAEDVVSGRRPAQTPAAGDLEELPDRHSSGEPWWTVPDAGNRLGCWETLSIPTEDSRQR